MSGLFALFLVFVVGYILTCWAVRAVFFLLGIRVLSEDELAELEELDE